MKLVLGGKIEAVQKLLTYFHCLNNTNMSVCIDTYVEEEANNDVAEAERLPPFMEHAGSLVPPFALPVKTWAKRIRQVLLARRLDVNEEQISTVFTPLIIVKLPSYMLHVVGNKNLNALLTCLENFEKGPRDPLSILNAFKTFQYEPSVE